MIGFLVAIFLQIGHAAQIYNARDTDVSFLGEEANDRLGYGYPVGIGDINGDGIDDLSMNAVKVNIDNRGKVYFFFGRETGWYLEMDMNSANASFIGDNGINDLGRGTAGGGDINGDGYHDVLIGAPLNGQNGDRAGKAYIVFGQKGGWKRNVFASLLPASYLGESETDFFGEGVAVGGDFDGDGLGDFAASAFSNEERGFSSGKLYLWRGKVNDWQRVEYADAAYSSYRGTKFSQLGYLIDIKGDVDRDGYDDLIAAMNFYHNSNDEKVGGVYMIFGRGVSWHKNYPIEREGIIFEGVVEGNWVNRIPAFGGDINGDGYSDLLFGFSDNDVLSAGKVYIFFGSRVDFNQSIKLDEAPAIISGEFDGIDFVMVTGIGDINGDGLDDFLVGSPEFPNGGRVYVFLGKTTGWMKNMLSSDADIIIESEQPNSGLGAGVGWVGDPNNDGYDDIIVSAPGYTGTLFEQGKVYLIFPFHNIKPSSVTRITLKTDETYLIDRTTPLRFGEDIFIEVQGVDADFNHSNVTEVMISTNKKPHGIKVRCIETGENTGIYHRKIWLTDKGSNFHCRRIGAYPNDWLTITSRQDANITMTYPIRNPTPTPSPTFTPNPGPKILLGGYWDTNINRYSSPWKWMFLTSHIEHDFVESVRLYYQGASVEPYRMLPEEENFFSYEIWITREAPPGSRFLFEFVAWDYDGVVSNVWPYLTVE